MKKVKRGMVLGKFMPLHTGHEYLIRFAHEFCEELLVVVDCLSEQTISTEQRKAWVKESFSNVQVVALTSFMPQAPEDTPDFWDIWREELKKAAIYATGHMPDMLIASGDYGWKLATELGCSFVQCDLAREAIPISATEIRANPMRHWNYLAPVTRGYFAKKVCFMGPESTGKSTCALKMARKLQTVYVPEYAKALIREQSGEFHEHNVLQTAMAQISSEHALERHANRIMVCDTDPLTTLIWSEFLYGRHPQELEDLVLESRYDMTFLFYPDVEFTNDVHRNVVENAADPLVRLSFLELCKKWLTHFNRSYVEVRGDYDKRYAVCYQKAVSLIGGPWD